MPIESRTPRAPGSARAAVALVHTFMEISGGSEAVTLGMAEALKDDYDVTIMTMGEAGLEELNRWHGTALAPGDVRWIRLQVPRWARRRFNAWRSARLIRLARRRAAEFDLMISSYNTMDFGRPGLQYISDFSFDDGLRRTFRDSPEGKGGWAYRDSLARRLYLAAGRRLSGSTGDGWRRNLTLANSAWTAGVMRTRFGMECRVVYPPVSSAPAPPGPWEDRRADFVTIGRLTPEKRIESMVHALALARARHPRLRFDIYGPEPATPYVDALRRLCAPGGGWAALKGPLQGAAKSETLAGYRFGISGRLNEPFGIAVAEMVRAGCIVWVPAGGGQVEIVDHPDLVYDSPADAAAKISAVLDSPARQDELRAHLRRQGERFSIPSFMEGVRAAAAEALARAGERP